MDTIIRSAPDGLAGCNRCETSAEGTMQIIAERIIKQRTARGLSQRALAEKLGISRTTLASIERGDDSVTMGTLLKVMDFLDMTLETKKVVRLPADGVFPSRPTLMQIRAMREQGLFASQRIAS